MSLFPSHSLKVSWGQTFLTYKGRDNDFLDIKEGDEQFSNTGVRTNSFINLGGQTYFKLRGDKHFLCTGEGWTNIYYSQ